MEHISGGRTYVVLPFCFKWSRFMIFRVMLWFLLFTVHAPLQAVSQRNMTYIVQLTPFPVRDEYQDNILGIKCPRFHTDQYPTRFLDNPCFHHSFYNLQNPINDLKYKHIMELVSATHRDFGYFDKQKRHSKALKTSLRRTRCEFPNLTRLWSLKILPWIAILEVVVILTALTLFPPTQRHASVKWKNVIPTSISWWRSIWLRLLMDWVHIYLLVRIGSNLMQAMRRPSVHSLQSRAFHDYSIVYLVLLLILSVVSILQQLVYWIGCAEQVASSEEIVKILQESGKRSTRLKRLFFEGNDYKWQPIAAQVAVLIALASFLRFPVDENSGDGVDMMWRAVLGFVLQVGCLWSGLYAFIMLVQRGAYMFKFFKKWKRDVANTVRC